MKRSEIARYEGKRIKITTVSGYIFSNIVFRFVSDDSDTIEFVDERFNTPVTMSCEFVAVVLLLEFKK